MNERIKQLELQSVIYNENEETWEFDRFLFAELIVRECVTVIEDRTFRQMGKEGVGWANGYGDGLKTGVWLIKQHFGVEE